MSKKQREIILDLLSNCCNFGEGWVDVSEIDEQGLAEALRIGLARALSALGASAEEEIIIDGKVNYAPVSYVQVSTVVDADQSIPLVSAASIHAKVTRDRFMQEVADRHPAYGFEKHVGYGTSLHRRVLAESGVLPGIHRLSYKPIRAMGMSV